MQGPSCNKSRHASQKRLEETSNLNAGTGYFDQKKKGQAKKALAKTDLASRDYQKQGLLSSLEIAGRN